MYIKVASVFTALWLGCLAFYVWHLPHLFMRMLPHELGELLAGWFAPLAAVWVGAAVVLQREQLEAQKADLAHASEALRLQSEEFQRSVQQLEKNAVIARLERLSERLMFGMQRTARTAEGCELHSPTKREKLVTVASVLGTHRKYAELFHSNEMERAVREFSLGLVSISQKITEDWVFTASPDIAEEVCTELTGLSRIAAEIERLAGSTADETGMGIPDKAELKSFREALGNASRLLGALLHDVQELNSAGPNF